MKHLLPSVALLAASLALAPRAGADIYRYVNNDGVTCFTDSPTQADAVVIIEHQPKNKMPQLRQEIPSHLAATGIAKKLGTHQDAASPAFMDLNLPLAGTITSVTGLRHDPIDGTVRLHNGIDIAVPTGTPVRAVSSGTVIFSGTRPGYGKMIIVDHGKGTITLYAHNSENLMDEGASVGPTSVIALSGSSGRSTGPHLHFEAWKDGINMTSAFVNSGAGRLLTDAATRGGTDMAHRIIQVDGSLILTNMR